MAELARPTGRDIDAWRRKVIGNDTPIFARTVHEVSVVAGDQDTSAADLSKVVGHDASMAMRLLRIAGSTLFNLQGRKIETISAAIVLIGFDAVKELAVSLALIEHVLKGRQHHRVTQNMAQAFHAAAQAKSFAALRKDDRAEEVFVAALLLRLGAMSFWAQGSEEGVAIERLVDSGVSMEEAERDVLGFTLLDLTRRLADEWHLGELLKATLDSKSDADPRVRSVAMGHEVAELVEAHGWDSSEVRELLKVLSKELEIPVSQIEQRVRANFDEAVKIADRYGVPAIDEALPPLPESERGDIEPTVQPGQPNPSLQAKVLEELARGPSQGRSLNELLALTLQGIHEGVGFDRTYFALLTPDRKQMQPRYVLGNNPSGFTDTSRTLRRKGDLFGFLLEKGEPVRLVPGDRAARVEYRDWLSYTECALMPIVVKGKPVGVLYADRSASKKALDEAAFASFRRFGEQIVALLDSAR